MTPFLDSDRAAWAALIEQALRLKNPKVTDFGPLKRAERACSGKVLPPEFQNMHGNPFSLLRRSVQAMPREDARRRAAVISQAETCLVLMPGDDVTIETHLDQSQPLTHIHDRRKDIYG